MVGVFLTFHILILTFTQRLLEKKKMICRARKAKAWYVELFHDNEQINFEDHRRTVSEVEF